MYRRMTLIGVLTAIASLLVFGIANALPSTSARSQTSVTTASDTTMSETSTTDSSTTDSSTPDSSTEVTAPESTETTLVDAAVVGLTTYEVADAGSVTIEYDGTTLSLVSADANTPWSSFSQQTSGREIEVEFANGDRIVKFNAELEDGGIRIRVRDEVRNSSTNTSIVTNDSDNRTDITSVTSTTIDDDDDSDELDDLDDDDDDHDDDSNRGSDDDDDDDDDHDDDDDDHGDDD